MFLLDLRGAFERRDAFHDETRFEARPAAFVDHEQLLKVRNFGSADWSLHAAKQCDGVVTFQFRHQRRPGKRAEWCSSPAVRPMPVDMEAYRSEFDDHTKAQRVALAEDHRASRLTSRNDSQSAGSSNGRLKRSRRLFRIVKRAPARRPRAGGD